jgi:hypothetical protein
MTAAYKNLAKITEGQPAEDADSDPDAGTLADLRARIAASEAARAEAETALGVLTEQLLTAAPAPAAPAAPAPPPEPPAQTPWQRTNIEMDALAILARERPEGGSRAFWRQQVDALGRHLAPEESLTRQRAAALDDPRGHAFVAALQSRPA